MSRDYQAPDWRGLCEELVAELERCRPLAEVPDCLAHARAALAQPGPEVAGPTDEELLGIAAQAIEPYDKIRLGEYEAENNCAIEVYGSELIAFARAVLARWGSSQGFLDDSAAPAPAGEVAELVAWLHGQDGGIGRRAIYARIADLLERQAAPVPVAVSERLPGAEDCDAEGRCWVHQPHYLCPESPAWELMSAKYASANYEAVCWLPANALPLPSGEAQP